MSTKISFVVTDDNKVMNTDVISVPINENLPSGAKYLGEVIVNEEQVARQAEEYGVSQEEEMARVVTHGVLHLLGYTDDTEKERDIMRTIEEKVVRRVVPNDKF